MVTAIFSSVITMFSLAEDAHFLCSDNTISIKGKTHKKKRFLQSAPIEGYPHFTLRNFR